MQPTDFATYSPEDMIAFAREHCPFYRTLYADLPRGASLDRVPVVDLEEYWQAHARDRNEVLTGKMTDGFVLNSGGTSGQPKYCYSTYAEVDATVRLSSRSFEESGLRDGDRVATLFAAGNLYASQMHATEAFRQTRQRVVQFPLGYTPAFTEAAAVIQTFQINVLAGFPTHLLRVIEHLEREGPAAPRIERIIYAGELFSKEQQAFLQTRFPGVEVRSAGYASVEAGVIGYAEVGCAPGEHRCYDGATVTEILDEHTGEPIEAVGEPGRIVFTSLFRRLMPTLRYPTGDRARWVEPPGTPDRKFLLLGRSEEAARIARFTVEVSEVAQWLATLPSKFSQFQLLVTREDKYDRLTIRIVAESAPQAAAEENELVEQFYVQRQDVARAVERGILHPVRVEWIRPDQLIVNERTGKLLRVVDRRGG